MKRETLLTILVTLLLLLNLGTIGFLFLKHRGGHEHHGPPPHGSGFHRPDELMKEKLRWNDEQVAKFEAFKEDHHRQMEVLHDQTRDNARAYFQLLGKTPVDTFVADSLSKVMGALEIQKAGVTYRHLQDLKSICTEEQQPKFDSLLPQLIEILLSKPKGPPPHHPPH